MRTTAAVEHGYIVRLLQLSTLGFIDGVLGMNFLSDFNFEIRPAQRRILVERIAPLKPCREPAA